MMYGHRRTVKHGGETPLIRAGRHKLGLLAPYSCPNNLSVAAQLSLKMRQVGEFFAAAFNVHGAKFGTAIEGRHRFARV